jgi:endogenous inhibitor of DNA gyrase (YacG/DUF329 family)
VRSLRWRDPESRGLGRACIEEATSGATQSSTTAIASFAAATATRSRYSRGAGTTGQIGRLGLRRPCGRCGRVRRRSTVRPWCATRAERVEVRQAGWRWGAGTRRKPSYTRAPWPGPSPVPVGSAAQGAGAPPTRGRGRHPIERAHGRAGRPGDVPRGVCQGLEGIVSKRAMLPTARAAPRIGSRSRTRTHRPPCE